MSVNKVSKFLLKKKIENLPRAASGVAKHLALAVAGGPDLNAIDPLSSSNIEPKELLAQACIQPELGTARRAATFAEKLRLAVRIHELEAVDHIAVIDNNGSHDFREVANRKENHLMRLAAFELRPAKLLAAKGIGRASKAIRKPALDGIGSAKPDPAAGHEVVEIIDSAVAIEAHRVNLKTDALRVLQMVWKFCLQSVKWQFELLRAGMSFGVVVLNEMVAKVFAFSEILNPSDASRRSQNDAPVNGPCLHRILRDGMVARTQEHRMKAEAQTVQAVPEAFLITIGDGVGALASAGRKRLPCAESSAEAKIVVKHDTALLMRAAEKVANFVHMSSNANVRGLPAAATVATVIANKIQVGARGIHEGFVDLIETGWVALKTVRAEDGKLDLAVTSTESSMATNDFCSWIPMAVEVHGSDVVSLVAIRLEVIAARLHGNAEKLALLLSVLVLLSILHAADFLHCLLKADDVDLSFRALAIGIRRIVRQRGWLPLLFKAEGAEPEVVAPHVLSRKSLPEVSSHAELPDCNR